MIVPRKNAPALLSPAVAQDLVSAPRNAKAAILRTLAALGKAGLIKDLDSDEANMGGLKRQLTETSTFHATHRTPYGPLIQTIDLGAPSLKYWEFVNPFA